MVPVPPTDPQRDDSPAITGRLYLDNAATSFPKPDCVHQAMLHYGTRVGGTAGRGTYREAIEGARIIRQCRDRLCRLFGATSPDHLIFTLNCTDALNLAIKGTIRHWRRTRPTRPIHLITSALDHNSVLRPFAGLAAEGVEWTCIPADPRTGRIDPASIRRAIRPDTALVAIVHASNVTGIIQPVNAIGRICRAAGVPFLVDAAQTAGHIPIDVEGMEIDLLAFPGHKGLLGPLGTGGLYIRPGLEDHLDPIREGGTGSRSEQENQPTALPDKYEPGSQNAIGIAGLGAAADWILSRGDAHWDHDADLTAAMLDGLTELGATSRARRASGLRLIGPPSANDRVGIFSLVHESLAPHELAAILEQEFGILGRAGLHCAPRAHAALGTGSTGGAYRLSTGPFITIADLPRVWKALAEIAREATAAPAAK